MARELEIRITADDTDARGKLRTTEEAITGVEAAGGRASRSLGGLVTGLSKYGTGIRNIGASMSVAVTAPILAVGGATIRAAMDAVESESLFETSFGSMAAAARLWSDQTAAALGLNQYELRRTSATVYTMVQSMGLAQGAAFDMATGVSELSGDMASFFNLSNEEAFAKLRAGLVGEVEPLRQLGIVLSSAAVEQMAYTSGIAAMGAELTEAEKVQARWLLIQQQAATASGDLARTLDSPTNQLRALQAQAQVVGIELGQALIPVLQTGVAVLRELLPAIQGAVQWFSNLPQPVQSAGLVVGALVVALGPLLAVVGQGLILLPGLTAAFAAAGGAAGILGTAVGILTGPIGLVVGAVVGLTAAWLAWGDDVTRIVTETYTAVKTWLWDKLEPVISPLIPLLQSIGEMFGAFGDLVVAVGEKIGRLFIDKVRDDWGRMTSFFDDTIGRIKGWVGSIPDALLPLLGPIGLVIAAFRHWDEITQIASAAYNGVKTWLLDRFQAVVDGIKGKVDAVTGFFRDMYTAVVGNSFVPDMIAGIGAEFGRLGDVMVTPAQGATAITEGLFGSMMTSVTQMLTSGFDGWKQMLGNTLSQMLSQIVSSKGSFQAAFQSLIPGSGGGGMPGGGGGMGIPDPAGMMFDAWMQAALGPHFNDAAASAQMEVDSFLEGLSYQGRTMEEGLAMGWGDGLSTDAKRLLGIPDLASGGVVLPRPGGTLVNVGEGGQAEAVVPLDRMDHAGRARPLVVRIDARGAFFPDLASIDRLAEMITRRVGAAQERLGVTA